MILKSGFGAYISFLWYSTILVLWNKEYFIPSYQGALPQTSYACQPQSDHTDSKNMLICIVLKRLVDYGWIIYSWSAAISYNWAANYFPLTREFLVPNAAYTIVITANDCFCDWLIKIYHTLKNHLVPNVYVKNIPSFWTFIITSIVYSKITEKTNK